MGKEEEKVDYEKSVGKEVAPGDVSILSPNTPSDPMTAVRTPGEKLRYPWHIVFILGNEFCERFSYYGMKTVLTLYFVEKLLWDDSTTTLVYHLFSMFAYFTPLFGAMLADGWLGKFNTIFFLSLVYVAGLVLLTLSAVPPLALQVIPGTACGLVLIALGTGGIKPCVPAYGGDQFKVGQEKQREKFFSVFYFAINAGSLISTFVTPILRSDVPCFGDEGCFPLAFGLPAGLLAVAIVMFVLGRPFYTNVPSRGNILGRVIACSVTAAKRKLFRPKHMKKADHWLDYAADSYDKSFIKDMKQLMPVLFMFLPLPMFWALFDQQGSRWTLQAKKMDGRITDDFTWKPDQVQIFNPVMILIMIPIFEGFVFPLLDKYKVPFKHLARMCAGMILAAVAFCIAAFIELALQNTLPATFVPGTGEVRIHNALGCNVQIDVPQFNSAPNYLKDYTPYHFEKYEWKNDTEKIELILSGCNLTAKTIEIYPVAEEVNSIFIAGDSGNFTFRMVVQDRMKPGEQDDVNAYFVVPFKTNGPTENDTILLINPSIAKGREGHEYRIPVDRLTAFFTDNTTISHANMTIKAGRYQVYYPDMTSTTGLKKMGDAGLNLPNGGAYSVIFKEELGEDKLAWDVTDFVAPSSLSVFLQLPQYFVMTVGEVLFSVSGLAFAYSQAPASMKSVLQAGWLLTVAFGNVIVVIVSSAAMANQVAEFFLFAGLIVAAAIIFAIMGRYYKYVDTDVVVTKKDDNYKKRDINPKELSETEKEKESHNL